MYAHTYAIIILYSSESNEVGTKGEKMLVRGERNSGEFLVDFCTVHYLSSK
jgi:hypothetical protein